MTKTDWYREKLKTLQDWDAFLIKESGLPGPRGNLELAQAVADEGQARLFMRFIKLDPTRAPTNSAMEFLPVCGAIGLGRLVAEGEIRYLKTLRECACDPRWRMREAVAMALQRVGDRDMDLLLVEMTKWSKGGWLEQRAAAAALCEPRLLDEAQYVKRVLDILDVITHSVLVAKDRKNEEFRALRQGMGYCWSVAVAASPVSGKKRMEKWFAAEDPDIHWIMKENLNKKRLERADPGWVSKWRARL